MSFGNPIVITYAIPAVNITAGAATAIKAPNGFSNGRILDVGCRVTTSFTAVTLAGRMKVGTTGAAAAYADLMMATADGGTGAAATDLWNTQNKPSAITEPDVTDEQIEVTFTAPTGGAPAGVGDFYITVAWF